MIRKLRRKFVLINMLFVSAVLLAVFAVLCLSTYRQIRTDTDEALSRALTMDAAGNKTPPHFELGDRKPDKHAPFLPVFCVRVDADGTASHIYGETVSVTDEEAAQAASLALADGKETGVLSGLGLRFLRQDAPTGTTFAFVDLSSGRATMRRLLLTSLLVGIGGLTAFFIISLFLSAWALRPVERAWERQRRFVADASHELKTPLTVILANTGILLSHREETIESERQWVENTKEEAGRMKTLVDELLFLARIDGAHTPTLMPLDLSDVVMSRLLPFESVAYEQGLTLDSRVEPGILVTGDAGQLGQLTAILLDNACKYADREGRVTLTLDTAQSMARLRVHNTGAPIPPAQLEHLFERFYRADDSRCREKGGYGLGLSIAQSIVETHKGKITVRSGEEGTVFTVLLPLHRT